MYVLATVNDLGPSASRRVLTGYLLMSNVTQSSLGSSSDEPIKVSILKSVKTVTPSSISISSTTDLGDVHNPSGRAEVTKAGDI